MKTIAFPLLFIFVLFSGVFNSVICGASDNSKELRVGSELDFPPYTSQDKNGEPIGFSIDLIRAVAEAMGLTVKDINATCEFYARVLGMRVTTFCDDRKSLSFGVQKINLHQNGQEFEPKAKKPTPGSADLCFVTGVPLSEAIEHLRVKGVKILEGPVQRTGAVGSIRSVYLRDPDGNLVEVPNYLGS